jgi:hypothetical protein
LKKSSLWLSAAGALVIAVALAGCGQTYYFAGRVLPPSGLTNRVMVAIQNPGALSRGALEIMDGFYDVRFKYNNPNIAFSISGFSGALPVTIQNMPEEQLGAVYGSGDNTFTMVDYQKEDSGGGQTGLNGESSSVFITRNQKYVFAASQVSHVLTVIDRALGGSYALNLPDIYRVSVNPGGTVAMAFVQNSNYAYYPIKLDSAQTLSYSGGPTTWPKAAVDCEPLNAPGWCLFQAQSPDHPDPLYGNTGLYYGAPLVFDRPIKAVFSNDGGMAYVLNCGPECGGAASSISLLPTGPMIFAPNQTSGVLPSNAALQAACGSAAHLSACTLAVPGGASNALVDSSTMYVVGQCAAAKTLTNDGLPQCAAISSSAPLFTGSLTVLNLAGSSSATVTAGGTTSISDGAPGAMSRIIEADDNTLWIGMTKCTNGERFAASAKGGYGCLTMYDTSKGAVTMIEPYQGDATGIAAVTSLHKVYVAEGGQVYVYATTDGRALNNQYVTVTGTAYDVAYIDGLSDANNTVY